METKILEVRDNCTTMPILAVRLIPGNGKDLALLSRTGYGQSVEEQSKFVITVPLECPSHSTYAPSQEGSPWESEVHRDIIEHWDELEDGDVVDPAFYRGDRPSPLPSDIDGARLRDWMELIHHAKEKT